MKDIFIEEGFQGIQILKDLQGLDRVILGTME